MTFFGLFVVVIVGLLTNRDCLKIDTISCRLSGISNHTQLTASIRESDSSANAILIGPAVEDDYIHILFNLHPLTSQKGWLYSRRRIQYHCYKENGQFQLHLRTATCTSSGGLKLNIPGATVEDSGNYSCTIRTNYGTLTATTSLNVQQTPTVEKIVLSVNGTVTLMCPSYLKVPYPHVKWRKENTTQSCLLNCQHLTITKATFNDSGKYSCSRTVHVADENKLEAVSKIVVVKVFVVLVTGKPGSVTVTLMGSRVKLDIEDRNSLIPVTEFQFACFSQTRPRTAVLSNVPCRNGTCYVKIKDLKRQLTRDFLLSNCSQVTCKVQAKNKHGLGPAITASFFNLRNNCTDLKNSDTSSVPPTAILSPPTVTVTVTDTSLVLTIVLAIAIPLTVIAAIGFIVAAIFRRRRNTKTLTVTKDQFSVDQEKQRAAQHLETAEMIQDEAEKKKANTPSTQADSTDGQAGTEIEVQQGSHIVTSHEKFPKDRDEVTEEDVKYFAQAGAPKWEKIGDKLLPANVIADVTRSAPANNRVKKLSLVLNHWKENRDSRPTIGELVAAFGNAGISKRAIEKVQNEK